MPPLPSPSPVPAQPLTEPDHEAAPLDIGMVERLRRAFAGGASLSFLNRRPSAPVPPPITALSLERLERFIQRLDPPSAPQNEATINPPPPSRRRR